MAKINKAHELTEVNVEKLFRNSELRYAGKKDIVDFNTKEKLAGKQYEVFFSKDDPSKYRQNEGEQISNLFTKITAKVPKDIDIPLGAVVELVNPKGKIYGDFRNMLSLTADDIKIISTPKKV